MQMYFCIKLCCLLILLIKNTWAFGHMLIEGNNSYSRGYLFLSKHQSEGISEANNENRIFKDLQVVNSNMKIHS